MTQRGGHARSAGELLALIAEALAHLGAHVAGVDEGEDIRRNLSRTHRTLTLPALIHAGHVYLDHTGRPQLTPRAHASLHP